MTKKPQTRPHGAREQAKARRRAKVTAVKAKAYRVRKLRVLVAEARIERNRDAGIKEIGRELHEPRIMSDETRALRRGRRAR